MKKTQTAAQTKANSNRELQTVKDLCGNLQALSIAQKKENKINGYKDLNDLQRMTDRLKMDDEMKLIEMESVVAIVNPTVRRQILRNNLMAHMSDEKAPCLNAPVTVAPNRIDFFIPDSARTIVKDGWVSVYATNGPWAARLQGKSMIAAMISQSVDQIRYGAAEDVNYSYISILARILDLAHPSHQLQASVLAYPLHAPTIIKKRLVALKYDITPHTEEYGNIDHEFAMDILSWFLIKGYTLSSHLRSEDFSRYPGFNEWSFGFGSDGNVFFKDMKRPYVTIQEEKFFQGIKSGGILLDLLHGTLCLVLDGKVQPPGFGAGARSFSYADQELQKNLIQSTVLIPTFSLFVPGEDQAYGDKPQMRVNFGRSPFNFSMDAMSCDQSLESGASKGK
ncbi:hypothetical protein HDU67_000040 [Dinochytrium kinnereticum]|nr:hypothetical protein HDU67_000040 [Dinochytrium kinnereticum]